MWALRASAMAAGGATPQAFSRRSVPPAVNLRSSFRTSPLVAPFTSSSAMGRRNKKIGSGKQPRRHLAEEIIEEILSRLPVKSLLRFQLVSKSWASLIGSERFIKTHLQNSRENADLANHRVIHDYLPEIALSSSRKGEISELQYSVHSLMNDPVPEPSGLEHLTDFHIVGCCNGLVCIRNPLQKSFYLWNPSTRICMELPKLETKFFINRTGLGWDESSGAYKVFVFLHVYAGMDRCVVYSSNTNEWEKVETDFDWGIFCAKEEGMLVNGRLHWHGFGKKIVAIVSLDLKSAEIGSMEHPRGGLPLRVITRDFVGRRLSLGVIGGCLSVAHHRRKRGEKLDVWVMKEYKDCSSWYRAMAVRLDHLIRPYYQPCLYMKTAFGMPRGGTANVLGQAPGGEILISYESFFLACHPKPKKKKGKGAVVSTLKEIENCGRVRAHLYFETLVSPKRILGQNVM